MTGQLLEGYCVPGGGGGGRNDDGDDDEPMHRNNIKKHYNTLYLFRCNGGLLLLAGAIRT